MAKENIIDSVISTPRTRELVRIAIPVLVRWAKLGQTNKTYGDLCWKVWHTHTCSYVGSLLGSVELVLRTLREQTGKKDIPTLNTLCKNPKDGLPSNGFDFVESHYSTWSIEDKQIHVVGLDAMATKYQHWDWVLNQLGLKPPEPITEDELAELSKPVYGAGGEGKEHRTMKEFIAKNPSAVGVEGVSVSETEHDLPSGDRLDVYFKLNDGNRVAIEVKPATSPEQDIMRGIFQCVKYKAVMEAIRTLTCGDYSNSTLLVIGGEMSDRNKLLAEELEVKYIENFKIG